RERLPHRTVDEDVPVERLVETQLTLCPLPPPADLLVDPRGQDPFRAERRFLAGEFQTLIVEIVRTGLEAEVVERRVDSREVVDGRKRSRNSEVFHERFWWRKIVRRSGRESGSGSGRNFPT